LALIGQPKANIRIKFGDNPAKILVVTVSPIILINKDQSVDQVTG